METSDRKVDVAVALRAYQSVLNYGERDGDCYRYEGLRASTDFDGYTITLTDGTITLRVFFHSRFSIEPQQGRAVDRFLARIRRVADASE